MLLRYQALRAHFVAVYYKQTPERIVVDLRVQLRDAMRPADTLERVPKRNQVAVNRRLIRKKRTLKSSMTSSSPSVQGSPVQRGITPKSW